MDVGLKQDVISMHNTQFVGSSTSLSHLTMIAQIKQYTLKSSIDNRGRIRQ